MHDSLPDRLSFVRASIATAERNAGRAAGSVQLVAVSKTFAADAVRPVLELGQRCFGENRVQEAMHKWPALREEYPDTELHLIGPLQSNKSLDAVRHFDVIQTVDRPKIARTIAAAMEKLDRRPKLFVQINTGEEPQKAGVLPAAADDFLRFCRKDAGLSIEGLMCIPPAHEEPALHFALLEKIADRNGLTGLSMGMSADYETAIAFGATHVRVGSAIFGQR
jgi:pyridoxal phosphate enzyme (YggS family)